MKITVNQLRKIIKEEISKSLNENEVDVREEVKQIILSHENINKIAALLKSEAALITLNIFIMMLGIWLTHWVEIRQNKYLNNLIEQDHRNIKRLTRPMLGFKS